MNFWKSQANGITRKRILLEGEQTKEVEFVPIWRTMRIILKIVSYHHDSIKRDGLPGEDTSQSRKGGKNVQSC